MYESAWAKLCEWIQNKPIDTKEELNVAYGLLLDIYSDCYSVKATQGELLHGVERGKSSSFELRVQGLLLKGYTQSERERILEIEEVAEVKAIRQQLFRVDMILKGAEKIEYVLKEKHKLLDMEFKLAGQGHN